MIARFALRATFLVALVLVVWSATATRSARAYTVSNVVSTGCHERISSAALRAARLELTAAEPLETTRDEQALVDDLQFTPDDDMRDLGGVSLLIGVRDNDLKGRDSSDLTELPLIHGDPKFQREHCLRSDAQDEPDGSEAALKSCRAFIREKVEQALAGLDANGAPDPAKRTSLPVYLALRHRVDASLPTYYVRMGQALHTMEDGFTHTFRTPDSTQVTVVLNWIDEINGTRIEARDGPPHARELDQCDDLDELRKQRRELATEAATDMFRVTLDPRKPDAAKMAALEKILDKYLDFSPGCTMDNGWCDAVERKYGNGGLLGCGIARPGSSGTPALCWGVVLGLLAVARRSWRRRARRAVSAAAALCVWSVLMAGKAVASPDEHKPPPPVTTPVAEPGPRDPSELAAGGYLGASASMANGAFATAIGARLRVSKTWSFGLDAEWNPLVSSTGAKVGMFNAYAGVILRVPLAYEQFNLRTTINLGMSRMLMDLYGVPNGSTGIYVGLSPLGLEWKLSRVFFLVLNPLNVAIPIPQLSGVPYSYPQYRFTIGLEAYAG